MSFTENLPRPSLSEPLLSKYENANKIADVGGGNAKDVGTAKASTNAVDLSNKWSKQFKPGDATGFTPAAERFSTDVLKLNTTSYAASGRLP